MSSIFLRRVCALAAAICSTTAWSLEDASTHAALGFVDSLHGYSFAPGFYFRADVLRYRSTRLNDGDGNRASADLGAALAPFGVPIGTPGTRGPVDLKVDGTYEQITLFQQTRALIPLLGNDFLGFGATFLYGIQRVDLGADVPVFAALGQATRRDLGSNRVSALGDTAIFPLYLGWNRSPWWFTANPLNVYVKTGSYDRDRAHNIGRNYTSWAPQLAVTYLSGKGSEVSAQLNYLKNSTNKATRYKNGDEVFVSFALRQFLSMGVAAGLSGYYYTQISDDKRGGVPVYSVADGQPDVFNNGIGNRGRLAAIGPTIDWKLSGWSLNVHWNHDYLARNMPQADRIWFKAGRAF